MIKKLREFFKTKLYNYQGYPFKLDSSTNAFTTIAYGHHEMHAGNHFFIKTFIYSSVGASTTLFAFTTPNTTKRIHAKFYAAPDVDHTINIYEGSVITGGTPITTRNNDRDSTNTGSLVAVSAPTHTTPGSVIWAARNGGGRSSVGVAPGANYEILAAVNTTYVFEIIKNAVSSTGTVDIDFWWYEHTPVN